MGLLNNGVNGYMKSVLEVLQEVSIELGYEEELEFERTKRIQREWLVQKYGGRSPWGVP